MKEVTPGQIIKILTLIKGYGSAIVQDLLGSGLLSDLLEADIPRINRDDFRRMLGFSARGEIFHITIPYSQPIEDEIKLGGFREVSSCITDRNFSTDEEIAKGIVEADAIIVPFSELGELEMTPEEIIAALDKKGLRPGTFKELVALYKQCGNQETLRSKLPIVALGSVIFYESGGCCEVANLGEDGSLRLPYFNWSKFRWSSYTDDHFLAFYNK